jgi:hypothetical protein
MTNREVVDVVDVIKDELLRQFDEPQGIAWLALYDRQANIAGTVDLRALAEAVLRRLERR